MTSSSGVIRANNDPKFYSRFRWLGLAMFGFMLYCLYDGYVKYPAQQERAVAYEQLRADHEELGKSEADLETAWEQLSVEREWPLDRPIKMRSDADIVTQYLMATFAALAGIWMWWTVWRSRKRWIEVSDEGLRSHEGTLVPFDQITTLEKRQWHDKGIAWAHYAEPNGSKRRFLIDNYKFLREETNAILKRVESSIDHAKISGGHAEGETPDTADESAPS